MTQSRANITNSDQNNMRTLEPIDLIISCSGPNTAALRIARRRRNARQRRANRDIVGLKEVEPNLSTYQRATTRVSKRFQPLFTKVVPRTNTFPSNSTVKKIPKNHSKVSKTIPAPGQASSGVGES